MVANFKIENDSVFLENDKCFKVLNWEKLNVVQVLGTTKKPKKVRKTKTENVIGLWKPKK